MTVMRTTIRLDDDLLREIKERAGEENASLTHVVNHVLRMGLRAMKTKRHQIPRFVEKTYDLGVPRGDMDRALQIAADLEDQEILRKVLLRK